jgi:hypothetical protein
MAICRCDHERSPAIRARGIHFDVRVVEQSVHGGGVAVVSRDHERCPAFRVIRLSSGIRSKVIEGRNHGCNQNGEPPSLKEK